MVKVAQVDADPPLSVQSAVATSPTIAPLAKWSVSNACWADEDASAEFEDVVELEELDEPPQLAARRARTTRLALAIARTRVRIAGSFPFGGIN